MDNIKDKVLNKIRVAINERYLSNYYTPDVVNKSNNLWEIDEGFVFSYFDHGIERLIFFVKEWSTLDKLLIMIDGGKYYLEYMMKSSSNYNIKNAESVARMKRLSNSDCNSIFNIGSEILKYKDAVLVEKAKITDAESINKMLWATFCTEISHLLYNDELEEKIENGCITIHKNKNAEIDALLQAEIMPKKFYINQVINKAERQVIHAILLNRLEDYVSKGGKYLYSWVEDNNIASIKFHKKYGMEEDGIVSMIYCIER